MKASLWFKSLAGYQVKEYALLRYIGHGKIGYVYEARSKAVRDWTVALKLIPRRPRTGWENELRKVSQLSTIQGVVHLHGLGTEQIKHEGRTELFQYTVWDYVPPGRNLNEYLEQVKICPTSFLVAVFEQVLRVLHACYAKNVRHGDLHPGNILIGDKDDADLDSSLQLRDQIYISDFGYGTTGGRKQPKDDYLGLAQITNAIVEKVEWDGATVTDRQMLKDIQNLSSKLLREVSSSERRSPLEILQTLRDNKTKSIAVSPGLSAGRSSLLPETNKLPLENMKVGQFQVSEMLGEEWKWWKHLFVSSVPAKSRILEPDISTVVTGPRGCGKTMLFRRLSERLMLECGPLDDGQSSSHFVGLYVNANDIADAFSTFPSSPSTADSSRLVCYANICILSELLAVQSVRLRKFNEQPSDRLLESLKEWLVANAAASLVVGENSLEHYRLMLEQTKWKFPTGFQSPPFPAFPDFSQHAWLPRFIESVRQMCSWISSKTVFIFLDDYTTPRVSYSMQRTLNRLFLQRTSQFVCKIATESATTFLPEDSSGKILQDGDDYLLIDIAEESLFMTEEERALFLQEVFVRRLCLDPRVHIDARSLSALLGRSNKSKTEFARRLRQVQTTEPSTDPVSIRPTSQRRGATKPKVLYHGADIFSSLWSGDTRIMIQLVQELLDETQISPNSGQVKLIDADVQDRVLRNRGGQWLEAQTRNQPTNPEAVEREITRMRNVQPGFSFTGGGFGNHLKAIVEAFVFAARQLLMGPTYKIEDGKSIREVPRMAFRVEIIDELRLSGLAAEIYKDLIRYGLFMRDARGKSVRGAMVPRLYLRRFLLPYCTLALSKRDSVPLSCEKFTKLLLTPDIFKLELPGHTRQQPAVDSNQLRMFSEKIDTDPRYDDLNDKN